MISRILFFVGVSLSLSANAVVTKAYNGVNYEWLDLSVTAGLSRNEVEARLANSADPLYGYTYADRSQVEDLLLSYMPWNGIEGTYGAPALVQGATQFQSDFGVTDIVPGNPLYQSGYLALTTDGYQFNYDEVFYSYFQYGLTAECGDIDHGCMGIVDTYRDLNGGIFASYFKHDYGFDASDSAPLLALKTVSFNSGHMLVRVSEVPVPAVGWLYLSALIVLTGRKRLHDIPK